MPGTSEAHTLLSWSSSGACGAKVVMTSTSWVRIIGHWGTLEKMKDTLQIFSSPNLPGTQPPSVSLPFIYGFEGGKDGLELAV